MAIAIRRALASVAVFAQVLLLFAPLIEVRDGDTGAQAMVAGIAMSSGSALTTQHGQTRPPHNPMTCPACIAQSLHAQLASSVRLPTVVVAEQAPTDFLGAAVPHQDPPSTHRSRAPPVAS